MFDPEFQTENIAYDRNEMTVCDGCGRTNPPNRLKCLYCGHGLNIPVESASAIKVNLRKLELWERGFNVIAIECLADVVNEKVAAVLSMETADLKAILAAGTPSPVARVESEAEAAIILNDLKTLGIKCQVISDNDLATDKPPVRLSKIDIVDEGLALTDFNTENVTIVTKDDLALIVPGIITAGKVDVMEKKRRGKETKLLSETTTAEDESILDIYSRSDANGFRIRMTGFDFSCLGEKKGLLATENLRFLARFLKEHSPNAKLVDNYSAIRHELGIVWEIESRKDSKGLQKIGFGKRGFGTVATTNNLNQFTKYSRLQWHLI